MGAVWGFRVWRFSAGWDEMIEVGQKSRTIRGLGTPLAIHRVTVFFSVLGFSKTFWNFYTSLHSSNTSVELG